MRNENVVVTIVIDANKKQKPNKISVQENGTCCGTHSITEEASNQTQQSFVP